MIRVMTSTFVLLLDFLGTFAFAISGALVAVRHRLDLFGVLVLSFAAAAAGGITRDVLLGATPPLALVDWRYLGVSTVAASGPNVSTVGASGPIVSTVGVSTVGASWPSGSSIVSPSKLNAAQSSSSPDRGFSTVGDS